MPYNRSTDNQDGIMSFFMSLLWIFYTIQSITRHLILSGTDEFLHSYDAWLLIRCLGFYYLGWVHYKTDKAVATMTSESICIHKA